jgi:hypothetical protein
MRYESSINFANLIKDLADMYTFRVEEVVLVELVANALDAKATRIDISFDTSSNRLTVQDNGLGMTRSQFEQYHDFAAGLKTRGSGIGFAGVGAKISFNVAERVITETRSDTFAGGSDWFFQRGRLVWDEIPPSISEVHGTKVEVRFRHSFSPSYSCRTDLLAILKRHYLSLLDPVFLSFYERIGVYQASLRFSLNGQEVTPLSVEKLIGLDSWKPVICKLRNGERFALGGFGLSTIEYPLGDAGVFISTYGKVIRSDLFNQFPGKHGPFIFGLIEVPKLIDFLTTAKCDFFKGRNPRAFSIFYSPLKDEFKKWLLELGVESLEIDSNNESRFLERELKKLAGDIPELGEFFGYPERKRVLSETNAGEVAAFVTEGIEFTFPEGEGVTNKQDAPQSPGSENGTSLAENADGDRRAAPISRKAKKGPKIAFVDMHEDPRMAWVDGNTITINRGHPGCKKMGSSERAKRLFFIFAIATALQRYFVEELDRHDLRFVDRMIGAWGKS